MPSYIFPLLIVVQVIAAFVLIGLVMLQQGKGADMGSAFGGGSAGSIFGAAGASNFFSRMTKWAAIVFFGCTLGLAYLGSTSLQRSEPTGPDAGLMEQYSELPAAPGVSGMGAPAAPTTDAAVPTAPAASAVPAAPATPATTDVPSAPAAEAETPAAEVPAAPAAQ